MAVQIHDTVFDDQKSVKVFNAIDRTCRLLNCLDRSLVE